MGIDPENNWTAKYTVLPGKEKVVKELKKAAKDSPEIFLATDMDREGEAIAWHLSELLGGDSQRYKRVVFNEITKNSIKQAFENPGEVNLNRVEAQQARRFLIALWALWSHHCCGKKLEEGYRQGEFNQLLSK